MAISKDISVFTLAKKPYQCQEYSRVKRVQRIHTGEPYQCLESSKLSLQLSLKYYMTLRILSLFYFDIENKKIVLSFHNICEDTKAFQPAL